MNEKETQMESITEAGMIVSNMVPGIAYFDTRFEIMQNNYEEVRRNQDYFREQLRDMKLDMDRRFNESHRDMLERFSQVDKRFEQVDKQFEQVNKRFEQVDKRFEQVDKRFEQVDKSLEKIIASIEKLNDKIDLSVEKLNDKIDQKIEKLTDNFDQKIEKLSDNLDQKIEKLSEKIDQRDERQRKFTLRMFSIAISVTGLSVMGILVKILNIV